MRPISSVSSTSPWIATVSAAGLAVCGALAMTVVLGAVAMLSAAIRGVPPAQVPQLLTADSWFPWFCAAAGVFSALSAGYISSRTVAGASLHHWFAAGVLTLAAHAVVVGLLGSPLAPMATLAYIGLTMPAVCLGCYLGSPSRHVVL
jgi:hypothetical protein